MLELELKLLIIAALRLEDVTPADIGDDLPLFGDGLGLDSIDALELEIVVQHRYGVSLPSGASHTWRDLASVRSLALWITNARKA